jgi:uncharacterized membrane protein
MVRAEAEPGGAMSRTTWIEVFLFLHILGAIAAVGPTLSYALWNRLGERGSASERSFALRGISWVDSHLATPAFIAQAVTGIVLILLLEIDFFETAWLILGVSLYVMLTVFAIAAYAPVVKRQVALAERLASEPGDDAFAREYAEVAGRARTFGIVAIVLVLIIVYLMVVKPELWSAG